MTPSSKFIDAFLDKISEYKYLNYTEDEVRTIATRYMKIACSRFNKICEVDLASYNDETGEFESDDIDDEIIDIVSEGMVAEWLKPYRNNSDNLENVLSTKDYSLFSTANLLSQIRDTEELAQKRFVNMMREYSYNHGDLTSLHI